MVLAPGTRRDEIHTIDNLERLEIQSQFEEECEREGETRYDKERHDVHRRNSGREVERQRARSPMRNARTWVEWSGTSEVSSVSGPAYMHGSYSCCC